MVMIERKMQRGVWTRAALNVLPDIAIAWGAAAYTSSGIAGFLMTLVGLQAVYFLIWVKNSLWSWLVYWSSGRRQLSAHLEDYLVRNRFPAPPEYVNDIGDYLSQVANSADQDCSLRVKAAVELGTLNGVKFSGRVQHGLQLHLAFEDALVKYGRRFPAAEEARP